MNRTNVLKTIFDYDEAGVCSEDEPEDDLQSDSSDEDDVIEGSVDDTDLLSIDNFNLIRSQSVTFENFTAMVRADSRLFFQQESSGTGGDEPELSDELARGRGRGRGRGARGRGRGILVARLEGGDCQAVNEGA